MRKKILSAALALCMLFGFAAALPENVFSSTAITASAETSNGFNYTVLSDGTVKITGLDTNVYPTTTTTTITVPATLAGKTVSAIGTSAFMMRNKLTSVTISNGITEIGSGAFMDCTGLKTVSIPASVKTIAASAFRGCTSLTSITLPKNLTTLGAGVFTGCKALTAIIIDSSNTAFASVSGVLYNKAKTSLIAVPPAVTSITIPGTLTTIPAFNASGVSFRDLSKLTTVVISEGTTTIGEKAFLDCPELTSITIPKSVTSIGSKIVGYHKVDNITYTQVSKYSSIVVKGYSNTAAQTYANNNSLKFQSLGTTHTHSWGTVSYTWSTDYKTCTAKRVCKTDSSHVETETATATSKVKTAASCTAKGTTTYTATFKNSAFTTQTKDVQDIAINSNNHSWNTPGYTWSSDGKSCTAKRTCKNNSGHVQTENATISSKVKTTATCTAKGTTTYTATFKNSAFTTQTKDVQDIAINSNNHSWNTPDYTWSSDGKSCTAKRTCKNNSGHVQTENATISSKVKTAATCTAKGTTTYTATFKNSAFTTQTKDVQDIAATGHTWKTPTKSDWTWNGYSSASLKLTCSKCGSTQAVNATITSKTVDPTSTADGSITYTAKVTYNSKTYTDTKSVTIPRNHTHTWGSPSYSWSTDYKTCTAKRVCKTDSSHVETETVTAASKVKTSATCTAKGTTTYTAAFKNSAFATQTKDVKDIPAKGHSWGTPTWTWGSGNKTATVKFTCSVCKTSQSPAAAVTVNASAAGGKMTFTAKTTFNSKSYSTARTGTIKRLSGTTRYTTSVEISKATYSSANTVILASGEGFADALAGVPLAAANNAPILLTAKDTIKTEVINEIKRLEAKKVIILGGDDTVSDRVKNTIENSISGITVERYQGSTRFGTAVEIAKKLNANPTEVFFVYGYKYPDALSVGSVAAAKNAPILYLKTNGDLDNATKAYLASIKKTVKNAYVIGGDDLIPDAMMKKAAGALGLKVGTTMNRVSGTTRYNTCVEVNKAFSSVLTGTKLCVATGTDFPDALSGGVYAAKDKAPLFLVNGKVPTLTLSANQKSYLKSTNVLNITIFGGSDTVPNGHITVIGNGLV